MRRRPALLALAFGLAMGIAAPAPAQEGVPGTGSIAGEGHPLVEGAPACTSESSDRECMEYWERHINWFNWDYKAPYANPAHRHMPPPFGFALINFVLFAFIIYRLAARPLKDFVRTRHLTIRRDLDEAAALHREAEARLHEYEAKIRGLDDEIEELLAAVHREAQAEKARIVAAAETQAERLKREAEAQIERELAELRRTLKAEAVTAAMVVAERIIGQQASDVDQAHLTERFIGELERPGVTPAPAAAAVVGRAS